MTDVLTVFLLEYTMPVESGFVIPERKALHERVAIPLSSLTLADKKGFNGIERVLRAELIP